MQKVLNQEEIDAMVRAVRGEGHVDAKPASQVHVEPWDVRRTGQIGREQLQTITLLHESFARNLTHSLGAYLRVVFAANLVSAEHLTYREFLQRVPETTYFASSRLDPTGLNAALQLDLKVAFPIIDLLLGGEGKSLRETRELSEVEVHILDAVARIVCRELGVAWQTLSLEFNFEQRLDAGEAQRLMPPEEKTLSLSFEITMPDVRGGLNLAIPAAVSNALLRKISLDWNQRRLRVSADHRQRLMRRLLDCPFEVELGAGSLRVPVRKVAELSPGSVLRFEQSVTELASLLVSGSEMFKATPARCGAKRAAKLVLPAAKVPEWNVKLEEKEK
ncbi:MAG TPA: FliM/FliN family flagellar motor switch protein [Candidatus Binatia bacterium]|nr:FliM/FliN family flagellar motor switch protein [Candidatus Binatia bacterium]